MLPAVKCILPAWGHNVVMFFKFKFWFSFCLQVLEQLKVFSEEDIDTAAEALNDVS